jgi:hypothetical protein
MHLLNNYMEFLSPPGLSTVDLLDNLKKWEKAWLTFSVGKEAATQTMYRPFQYFSDKFLLRSGYLIEVRSSPAVGWSYVDLSTQCDINGRERSAAQWKDIKFESLIRTKWALDIDQKLVAVSSLG